MNKFFLLTSIFCVFSTLVWAQKPVILSDELDELCLAREYVMYMEDTSTKLGIHEIVKLDKSDNSPFKISTFKDLINSHTHSAYWLKFIISNESDIYKSYRIEMFDFNIDEISLFYKNRDGQFVEHKAGYNIPFKEREIGHKNVSFDVSLDNNQASVMYMRFLSKRHNILEPMLRSYERIINYSLGEYILFGIFYGLLLLILSYNLLYFILLRKLYYLYYVIYASGIFIYLVSKNGTGFQYLWSNLPSINPYTEATGLFIGTIAMLFFTIYYLDLKKRAPKIYNYFILAIILRVPVFVFQVVFPDAHWIEVIDVIYIQIVFVSGIQMYKKGQRSALWFMIAYSLINLAFIIAILEQYTIIPSGIFSVYSVNMGIILQFVFLSIGIGESVKETYKERNEVQSQLILEYQKNEILKEKVNKELEDKVHQRTRELSKAKMQLEEKAEEINMMNLKLDLANNELKKYISAFAKSSVMKSHLDFSEFQKAYPNEFVCQKFLMELKEKRGFVCKKCGSLKSIKGKGYFDIRCAKCNYNESLTANTIFHKIKFPIQKAFYLIYVVSQSKTDIPASDLAKVLELQNITCQNFKKKIKERMANPKKYKKLKDHSWDHLILDTL